MKLRVDLLQKLTPEMLMKGAAMNAHRYKAEPLFSKTGVGYLATATPEDIANEDKLSEEILRELMKKPEQKQAKPAKKRRSRKTR